MGDRTWVTLVPPKKISFVNTGAQDEAPREAVPGTNRQMQELSFRQLSGGGLGYTH